MSFFDDASLAFLPSGGAGKDGKAYSIKPTDGTGDFTFSRGSNLTATRVGPTGLIEKGRENLLLQSNQFDTTWSTPSATYTAGQSGYDGSSNAWLITQTGLGGYIRQTISASGVNTGSVYVKGGSTDWLALEFDSTSPNPRQYFQLTGSGVKGSDYGSAYGVVDAKIELIGNSWYRISLTSSFSISQFRIRPAEGDGDTSGTSSSIYIQDAQLELGLAATDYIESGASTGKARLLENEPRFDYSGGATCPSLLLEPSRTNLIMQSEYLTPINGGAASYNEELSPEGYYNGTSITFGATVNDSATMGVNTSVSILGNSQYTFSFYAKSITGDGTFKVRIDTDTTTSLVGQNITTTSEWDRYTITFTTDAGATSFSGNCRFQAITANNKIAFYGLQVEQGSYPTSYIPNHSGGSATRTGDSLYKQNINSILGSEGTLYLEIEPYDVNTSTSVFKKILGLFKTNGSVADAIYLEEYNGNWGVWVRKGNSTITSTGYKTTQPTKVAVTFGTGGSKIYFDGVQQAFTAVDTSNAMNQISTQSNAGAGIESVLKVKQLVYFPTALSDADCITLTT